MKTSLETLCIIFAWFRGKTATRRNRTEGNGQRERERVKLCFEGSVCFRFQRLFNDLRLSRGTEGRACYSFNVRRINYHKNARVMRINIASWLEAFTSIIWPRVRENLFPNSSRPCVFTGAGRRFLNGRTAFLLRLRIPRPKFARISRVLNVNARDSSQFLRTCPKKISRLLQTKFSFPSFQFSNATTKLLVITDTCEHAIRWEYEKDGSYGEELFRSTTTLMVFFISADLQSFSVNYTISSILRRF